MSLFSVCLHFLRYVRSCEHVRGAAPYCRLCSRVCDTEFKSRNVFQDLIFSKDKAVLRLNSNYGINLDVFLSNADVYFKYFFEKNEKCCYFQSFNRPEDVFAAFSSILLRIYLHLCFEFFSYIDLNISDNRGVRNLILNPGCYLLSKFWHETNIDFWYEFFDIFDKYNLSFCFKNSVKNPQFGPYYSHAFDTTLTIINP